MAFQQMKELGAQYVQLKQVPSVPEPEAIGIQHPSSLDQVFDV